MLHDRYGNKTHIYVHLLPHSHDDVGWLKTVDMYFSGTYDRYCRSDVYPILDNVIPILLEDPSKRFSYVEMKFMSMWWSTQTTEMKNNVRMLIKEGRLEIVNGGWSMHDEACTHYEDQINNMMKGHQFAWEELGAKPKIGWHIDPFGHTTANPRLFAEMGFDAFFFARIDYQDKA
jgi:alpha-mannosidase